MINIKNVDKNNKGICPINFNDFNVFDFYNEYKNLKRVYIFDILKEFNFISEQNGTFGITFDPLTKIGLFVNKISIAERHKEELNKFFMKIIFNQSVGYALPIFRFNGEVFSRFEVIRRTVNLDESIDDLTSILDDINELKLMRSENADNKMVIFDMSVKDENVLTLNYYYYKLN